eukprot:IDg17811t1
MALRKMRLASYTFSIRNPEHNTRADTVVTYFLSQLLHLLCFLDFSLPNTLQCLPLQDCIRPQRPMRNVLRELILIAAQHQIVGFTTHREARQASASILCKKNVQACSRITAPISASHASRVLPPIQERSTESTAAAGLSIAPL